MATTVENSIEINRPVDEVFAFVDDYRNSAKYLVGMTEYKLVGDKAIGVGARFRFTKKTTGLPDIKSEVEVTEWVENKKAVFRSYSGFENSGSWSFSSRGDKTVATLSNTFDLSSLLGGGRGGLLGGIGKALGGSLGKVAEGQARKDLTTSLERLKTLIERQPAPKAAPRPTAKKTSAKSAAKPAAKSTAKPAAKSTAKPAAKKKAASKPTTRTASKR